MKKVIVAGSRTFNDFSLLDKKLSELFPEKFIVISGMARGADRLAVLYAKKHNLHVVEMPAKWEKYGRAAGYMRNKEMANIADALVAFWDGKSKGTQHMINLAKKKGINVHVFLF